MLFSKPQPFGEAKDHVRQKTLMPTSLGSDELAKLDADVRERARFSAKVRIAEHLSVIDDGVAAIVDGKVDLASARLNVKQFLARINYRPPTGKEAGLEDLSSDERIDLQLLTNVQQAQGYGWWKQGQDPALLDAFPAREFLRVESREKPRSDWPQRWNAARAATTMDGATDSGSGRMVALVNHPIWSALSRFGTPYEPYDFGSGMGTEDVAREDAIALGILEKDTQVPSEDRPFNSDLEASPKIRSQNLLSLLDKSGVGRFDAQGVFVADKRRTA